jgi:hypothetical protein
MKTMSDIVERLDEFARHEHFAVQAVTTDAKAEIVRLEAEAQHERGCKLIASDAIADLKRCSADQIATIQKLREESIPLLADSRRLARIMEHDGLRCVLCTLFADRCVLEPPPSVEETCEAIDTAMEADDDTK